eukprot:gene41760-65904_t
MLIGSIYSLLGVRSPAPPIIALMGLLGILLGEQAWAGGHQLLSQGLHAQNNGNAAVLKGRSAMTITRREAVSGALGLSVLSAVPGPVFGQPIRRNPAMANELLIVNALVT